MSAAYSQNMAHQKQKRQNILKLKLKSCWCTFGDDINHEYSIKSKCAQSALNLSKFKFLRESISFAMIFSEIGSEVDVGGFHGRWWANSGSVSLAASRWNLINVGTDHKREWITTKLQSDSFSHVMSWSSAPRGHSLRKPERNTLERFEFSLLYFTWLWL